MRTSLRVFWQPKAGNSAAEYEDACWPRESGDRLGVIHLAVADGATETSFSGLWARLLVSAFGRGRLTEATWDVDLRKIRRVWQRAVGQKPLPWYAEEKLRLGAFSSLTGLTLIPPAHPNGDGGEFQALSVGDSCLFQLRREQLVWSFPFSTAEEFNSRPLLISSLDRGAEHEIAAQRINGDWQPGDVFYLLTDALACWALRLRESGTDSLAILRSIESSEAFEILIVEQRVRTDAEGIPLLKNDDVTLVISGPI
ncbi:MAG TPA: hypothetical protein VGH74_16480 [Planctomycetaceae bacterium]